MCSIGLISCSYRGNFGPIRYSGGGIAGRGHKGRPCAPGHPVPRGTCHLTSLRVELNPVKGDGRSGLQLCNDVSEEELHERMLHRREGYQGGQARPCSSAQAPRPYPKRTARKIQVKALPNSRRPTKSRTSSGISLVWQGVCSGRLLAKCPGHSRPRPSPIQPLRNIQSGAQSRRVHSLTAPPPLPGPPASASGSRRAAR